MNNTTRILAENVIMSNNTRETGINNNDLIIGPSGAGKTRGYVIPNILNTEESLIIADTKGNLRCQLETQLKQKGFHVLNIDFKNIQNSLYGYNPLHCVRKNKTNSRYNEQDIITISHILCPIRTQKDPFWEESAQMYLQCLISYVLKCLPPEEHHLDSVSKLADRIGTTLFNELMEEVADVDPDCFTARRYRQIRSNQTADRMDASIKGFIYSALNAFSTEDICSFFTKKKSIDLKRIGREKTVVFLEISDTDRSRDALVNLFYTQAFQALCEEADSRVPHCRLKVPVRFILDDFATNTIIPHFDNLISVIRSREISVSLIVQSLSQLESLYGSYASQTIINNCDNMLYLGGSDIKTAQYIALKLNKTVFTILSLPNDSAFLFTRGQKPQKVQKCCPEKYLQPNSQKEYNL